MHSITLFVFRQIKWKDKLIQKINFIFLPRLPAPIPLLSYLCILYVIHTQIFIRETYFKMLVVDESLVLEYKMYYSNNNSNNNESFSFPFLEIISSEKLDVRVISSYILLIYMSAVHRFLYNIQWRWRQSMRMMLKNENMIRVFRPGAMSNTILKICMFGSV